MAITVYEFDTVDAAGEPVFPPTKKTTPGGAAFLVEPTTRYVVVSSSAAGTLEVGTSATNASAGSFQLEAGRNFGFPVKRNTGNTYIHAA